MTKKVVFCLILLVAVTTTLFAQYVQSFSWTNHLSHTEFLAIQNKLSASMSRDGFIFTITLPNVVSRAINNELGGYSLKDGDVFMATIFYRGTYIVVLRIVDRGEGYDFYAYYRGR